MPEIARTTGLERASNRASNSACSEEVSQIRLALSEGGRVLLATEPSLEGVLAAVGMGYLAHARPDQIRLAQTGAAQPMLDESVIDLGTGLCDEEVALAERVLTGAKAHGADVYQLRLACGADDERMPEVVHRYLRLLFSRGSATRWLISDPVVVAFTDLARRVSGECEHTKQFLRFSHLSDDSWAARFSPRDSTIPLVGDHFARRMRPERFFIVDPRHQIAAFHEKDRAHCVYARMDAELVEQLGSSEDVADDEAYVRAMWKRLYDGLELEGRGRAERGYDLRMHFMPKRFWDGLPELDPRSDDPGDFVPERYRG